MTDFRIEGLDEQIEKMLKAAKNKKKYEDLRYKVGKKHLDNCAITCPEKSGRLKASFKRQPFNGEKEWILFAKHGDTIEAGTKVWYARLVAEGHKIVKITRTKTKNGRIRRNKKVVGFAKPRPFMEQALEMTNRDIPQLVDEFIRDVGKEAGFDVSK